MRRLLLGTLALAVVSSGCAPLYGGKPEKLRSASKKKRPPEADADATVPWVDQCETKGFFLDGSKLPRPSPRDAVPLLEAGQVALAAAKRSTDPAARGSLLVEAVSKLQNALVKDPFSAEITGELAGAYARVLRKGCALAMLKRLAALEGHSDYSSSARRAIDAVLSDGTFAGFRSEADAAVGR